MKRFLIGFSGLLCLVACSGTDVPVGDAGGGASGNTSGGAAGMPAAAGSGAVAGSATSGAGGAPQDPRSQALSYASKDIPCSVDSDCCVVVDMCLDTGYLVGQNDRDTVRGLLDGASMDRCLACIPPPVQVTCEAGKCLANLVTDDSTASNEVRGQLRSDHCGSLDINAPMKDAGSQFGCGVAPQ